MVFVLSNFLGRMKHSTNTKLDMIVRNDIRTISGLLWNICKHWDPCSSKPYLPNVHRFSPFKEVSSWLGWVLFGLHIFKASEFVDYRFWRTAGGRRLTEGAKLSRKATTYCRIDKMKKRELPAIKTKECLILHLVNFIFPPFCTYIDNNNMLCVYELFCAAELWPMRNS